MTTLSVPTGEEMYEAKLLIEKAGIKLHHLEARLEPEFDISDEQAMRIVEQVWMSREELRDVNEYLDTIERRAIVSAGRNADRPGEGAP